MEQMAIQSGVSTSMELVSDYILVRKPALPRWWDPVSRPHVAVIIDDPASGRIQKYYLSQGGQPAPDGRTPLEVSDIDGLPDGTLLEVRFSVTKANLFRLEMMDCVPCWRWVGRCRGLPGFDSDGIDWTRLMDGIELYHLNGFVAN